MPRGCLAQLQQQVKWWLSLNTIVRLSVRLAASLCLLSSRSASFWINDCSLTSHFLSFMAYFISFPTAVSFQFQDPGSHKEFRTSALCREDVAMAWLRLDLGL